MKGGVYPEDALVLEAKGLAAVYTPKDFQVEAMLVDLVDLARRRREAQMAPAGSTP